MKIRKALVIGIALLLLAVSCATMKDPYPNATREIIFRDRGATYFRSGISETGDFLIPSDPTRENCTFNGWWVTCEEGVVELTEKWVNAHPEVQSIEANARWINTSYTLEDLSQMGNTQDGAIYGDYLMRFNASGMGQVFSMPSRQFVGSIALDSSKLSVFKPHSNCVCFGSTFYAAGDEFPLLYSNAYNNYDVQSDRMLGTVGAYRITRNGKQFKAELTQIIRIGFSSDKTLWLSSDYAEKSPFGNMVVDTDNNKLWFFVTRDKNKTTRFFSFEIPSPDEGEYSELFGVNVVSLQAKDIVDMFDVPYSNYLQGACYHDGMIYSTEGMGTAISPNVIRVVDLENKTEDCVIDFFSNKYRKEAEFIDFHNGICYFSDFTQTMYKLSVF